MVHGWGMNSLVVCEDSLGDLLAMVAAEHVCQLRCLVDGVLSVQLAGASAACCPATSLAERHLVVALYRVTGIGEGGRLGVIK